MLDGIKQNFNAAENRKNTELASIIKRLNIVERNPHSNEFLVKQME